MFKIVLSRWWMFLQSFPETPRGSLHSLGGIGLASEGSRLADTDKVITGRAHSNCSFLLSEHLHNYITAGRGIAADTDLAICWAGAGVCKLVCCNVYTYTHITWHGCASRVYYGTDFIVFVRSWQSVRWVSLKKFAHLLSILRGTEYHEVLRYGFAFVEECNPGEMKW